MFFKEVNKKTIQNKTDKDSISNKVLNQTEIVLVKYENISISDKKDEYKNPKITNGKQESTSKTKTKPNTGYEIPKSDSDQKSARNRTYEDDKYEYSLVFGEKSSSRFENSRLQSETSNLEKSKETNMSNINIPNKYKSKMNNTQNTNDDLNNNKLSKNILNKKRTKGNTKYYGSTGLTNSNKAMTMKSVSYPHRKDSSNIKHYKINNFKTISNGKNKSGNKLHKLPYFNSPRRKTIIDSEYPLERHENNILVDETVLTPYSYGYFNNVPKLDIGYKEEKQRQSKYSIDTGKIPVHNREEDFEKQKTKQLSDYNYYFDYNGNRQTAMTNPLPNVPKEAKLAKSRQIQQNSNQKTAGHSDSDSTSHYGLDFQNLRCTTHITCQKNEACSPAGLCAQICKLNKECTKRLVCHHGMCIEETNYVPQCKKDIHCSENQFCTTTGVCQESCSLVGCDPMHFCYLHKCNPKIINRQSNRVPSCQDDLSCPRPLQCDKVSQLCFLSCSEGSPCSVGEQCKAGRCVQFDDKQGYRNIVENLTTTGYKNNRKYTLTPEYRKVEKYQPDHVYKNNKKYPIKPVFKKVEEYLLAHGYKNNQKYPQKPEYRKVEEHLPAHSYKNNQKYQIKPYYIKAEDNLSANDHKNNNKYQIRPEDRKVEDYLPAHDYTNNPKNPLKPEYRRVEEYLPTHSYKNDQKYIIKPYYIKNEDNLPANGHKNYNKYQIKPENRKVDEYLPTHGYTNNQNYKIKTDYRRDEDNLRPHAYKNEPKNPPTKKFTRVKEDLPSQGYGNINSYLHRPGYKNFDYYHTNQGYRKKQEYPQNQRYREMEQEYMSRPDFKSNTDYTPNKSKTKVQQSSFFKSNVKQWKCIVNFECAEGLLCNLFGFCVSPCNMNDNPCPWSHFCRDGVCHLHLKQRKCLAADECKISELCASHGHCVPKCGDLNQCADGFICSQGLCSEPCNKITNQCPDDQMCRGGRCQVIYIERMCNQINKCGEDEVCDSYGFCVKRCRSENPCLQSHECIDGRCHKSYLVSQIQKIIERNLRLRNAEVLNTSRNISRSILRKDTIINSDAEKKNNEQDKSQTSNIISAKSDINSIIDRAKSTIETAISLETSELITSETLSTPDTFTMIAAVTNPPTIHTTILTTIQTSSAASTTIITTSAVTEKSILSVTTTTIPDVTEITTLLVTTIAISAVTTVTTTTSPVVTTVQTTTTKAAIPYQQSVPYVPPISWEDSTFVVTGGRNEFMVNLNTVEKVELQSSCILTPKTMKRMPFAIYDHMSFFVGGKFIFCGGHKRPNLASNQCFGLPDTPGANWTELPKVPKFLYNSADATIKNKAYIIGGFEEEPVDYVFSFDSSLDKWAEEPKLSRGRTSPCAVSYGDTLYVTGSNMKLWINHNTTFARGKS